MLKDLLRGRSVSQLPPDDVFTIQRGAGNTKRRSGLDAYVVRRRQTNLGNKLDTVTLTIRKTLMQELFPGQDRFDYSRGQAPHHQWLRIYPSSRGLKLGTGALQMSASTLTKPDIMPLDQKFECELQVKSNALYVRLPDAITPR